MLFHSEKKPQIVSLERQKQKTSKNVLKIKDKVGSFSVSGHSFKREKQFTYQR